MHVPVIAGMANWEKSGFSYMAVFLFVQFCFIGKNNPVLSRIIKSRKKTVNRNEKSIAQKGAYAPFCGTIKGCRYISSTEWRQEQGKPPLKQYVSQVPAQYAAM